jgi:toxin FitB
MKGQAKGLLLDTNVLSELRKGARCNDTVRQWVQSANERSFFLSVLVLGEIRRGIEKIRTRDVPSALALDQWLTRIKVAYEGRILPVDQTVADVWGRLDATFGLPQVDGMMAATASVHDLVLVTRNTKDFARAGIRVLNPFHAS